MGKTRTKRKKLTTIKISQPRSSNNSDSSPPPELVRADPSLIPRLSPELDPKKFKRKVSTDQSVLPPSKSHLGGHLKFATGEAKKRFDEMFVEIGENGSKRAKIDAWMKNEQV